MVSFYGVYFYNAGHVAIWDFPCANTEHTLTVAHEPLPSDSPDFMPVEALWRRKKPRMPA